MNDNINLPWSEWHIVKELGRGSFGAVYEIERSLYSGVEKAAVKIINIPENEAVLDSMLMSSGYDQSAVDRSLQAELKRAEQEYLVMSRLKGITNIVSCEDFKYEERPDGKGYTIYIRMELLKSLKQLIREYMAEGRYFTEDEVIKIGEDVCRALAACEQRGLVHRDIKPQNILVSEYGDYKIGDFGTARSMDRTTHATYVGTVSYMAPEVFRREPYGKTADIYSLGLVLYWLMNRCRMPFIAVGSNPTTEDLQNAENRRLKGEPLPPPHDASSKMTAVILKACTFRPEDRYSSAAEMLEDLTKLKQSPRGEETVAMYHTGRSTSGIFAFPETVSPDELTETMLLEPGYNYQPAGRGNGQDNVNVYQNSIQSNKNRDAVYRKAVIALAIVAVIAVAAAAAVVFRGRGNDTAAQEPSASENGDSYSVEDTGETEENVISEEEQDDYADDLEYEIYSENGYHIFYFNTDGGEGEFDTIAVREGETFYIPSWKPVKEGYEFLGWNVQRLVDEKWYCKDVFNWINWDYDYSAENEPSLYTPGMSLLFDDSWEKNGGSGSNYVLYAVWD